LKADVPGENEDSGTWDEVRWNHETHGKGGDGGPSSDDPAHEQDSREHNHCCEGGSFAELSQRMTRVKPWASRSEQVRLRVRPCIAGDGVDDPQIAEQDHTSRAAGEGSGYPNIEMWSRSGRGPHDDREQEGDREWSGGGLQMISCVLPVRDHGARER
jgi:hypothetical protein